MTPGVTVNQSMDERVKEFRNDPEKMNVTTKFVNEVVEKAKDEALRRMKERERDRVQETKFDGEILEEAADVMNASGVSKEVSESEGGGVPGREASSPECSHPFVSVARRRKYRSRGR